MARLLKNVAAILVLLVAIDAVFGTVSVATYKPTPDYPWYEGWIGVPIVTIFVGLVASGAAWAIGVLRHDR